MEEKYAHMYIRPTNWWFREVDHQKCYQLRRVVFRAVVASPLESALESALDSAVCLSWAEVYLFLCVSSASVDTLWCNFGQKGIWGLWFWRSIAGCLAITAFTLLCPGNSTPCFFSCRTSARGFLNHYFFSSTVARENRPLEILARFKARSMLDCSSYTRPPCLAIGADMLNTYKKSVAASNTEMRL
jgi:hypothetical protein